MRIGIFTENYYCGGLDTFIINLINNWPQKDDEIILISNKSHPGIALYKTKIHKTITIIEHNMLFHVAIMNKLGEIKSLWLVKKSFSFLFNYIARYILFAFYIILLKSIFAINELDRLLIVNGGYPGGDSCRAATITWGIFSKKPQSIHNFHNLAMIPKWYFKFPENMVDMAVAKYTEKFVTVSQAAARSMKNRPFVYKTNKTIHIYNGIEPRREHEKTSSNTIKSDLGIPFSAPLCLMMGTYEQRKGHDFLLKAFKKVLGRTPDAHLLICGFGYPSEINMVKQLIECSNLAGNVHLKGFVNNISDLYENTDILLLPSQEYESFGLTCIEAMAYEVPVIATNIGGIPEALSNEDGGYLFSPNDVNGFANKIVELLANEDLRKKVGKKGFLRFQKYFTAKQMSEQYCELIHSI